MSILKKPYELSLWRDVWNGSKFEEKRFMTIGSDTMNTPLRAMNVQLKRGINGSNDLTFKMYYRCQDTVTGEWMNNPWTDELVNETKLKLHYKNKWYDFIIKDIKEDSSNKCYTYSAIDQHIQELSKNGYDVELDAELMNNTGTATELAKSILSGTDWEVDGEVIPQLTEETLVELTVDSLPCYRLIEENDRIIDFQFTNISGTIYAFYSCCQGAQSRFSFIHLAPEDAQIDENGILTNKNCQYIRDAEEYEFTLGPNGYYIFKNSSDKGIYRGFRAKKYVFSQKIQYHPILEKYVYSYSEDKGIVTAEKEEDFLGYSETKYIAPVFVKNYVSNNLFKSKDGWHGEYIDGEPNDKDAFAAKVSVTAVDEDGNELINSLLEGSFSDEAVYEPTLRLEFQSENSIVTNSGFYDNRFDIKNLAPKQKFILLWRGPHNKINRNFKVEVGTKQYSVSENRYIASPLNETFIEFTSDYFPHQFINGKDGKTWAHAIGTVVSDYSKTETVFQNTQTRIFITADAGTVLEFADFQIIPFYSTNGNHPTNTEFLLPADISSESAPEATSEVIYHIFNKASNENKTDPKDFKYIYEGAGLPSVYEPYYVPRAEKVTSISIKQSNYFNSIQSLCEAFECWADFQVEHDSEGYITSKKVYIKNYISKDNYAGLRAGVNLKQTSRGRDSKQIVTKLIVPANSNEHGKNGFCTIARSDYNETGENCIYNFEYYIKQGLLNKTVVYEYFYGNSNDEGYYSKLKKLNNSLQKLNNELTHISSCLVQVKAELSKAEKGKNQSEELYIDAADQFLNLTGCSYDSKVPEDRERIDYIITNSSKALELLTQIAEYRTAYQTYDNQFKSVNSTLEQYEKKYQELFDQFKKETKAKKELINSFYKLFGRFLLEGTWKDDKCMDDNLYYLNALSTSNNSNFPQVTYQFSVLDVSILPNYEYYDFELGDKTCAEDTEFFGYNKDGTPYREEVIISEITYNLDDPTANSFQVRNFKNQFQDLFQKVTATVQNVSYASGSYDRAASFIEAAADKQAQFLQAAMQDANMVLKNAGQQSVTWGTDGITVTDVDTPSEQIRIVGGAIMLRDPDFGAGEKWVTAITAKGINAKVITAGRIDTQLIQIMNGTQPAFRWDYHGITAFDTKYSGQNTAINNSYNPFSGIRFDRFGVYSFYGTNGEDWSPNNVGEILKHSGFALTNEGFSLNFNNIPTIYGCSYVTETGELISTSIEHKPGLQFGRVEGIIYNSWDENGMPYYKYGTGNNFVKVFSIKQGQDGKETLAIYDDGTLVTNNIRFTGKIEWAQNVSFISYIYCPDSGKLPTLPANGTKPENVPEPWTTTNNEDSFYYAITTNNGANWEGPWRLTGKDGAQGLNGDKSETVVAYYLSEAKAFPQRPDGEVPPDSSGLGWQTSRLSISESKPYLFQCYGSKNTTYKADGTFVVTYIWGEVKLTEAALLDQNGLPDIGDDGSVISNSSQAYLEYLTLSDFGTTQGLGWGSNGKLFITATILNVTTENGKPIFLANAGERNVQIGSFIVDQYGLRGGTSKAAYYGIIGNANIDGIVFYAGATDTTGASPKFSVTNSGILKAIDADIKGIITATEGYIGDIEIVNGGIQAANFSISNTGILEATNAIIQGTISANKGDIGGIKISKNGISGGVGSQISVSITNSNTLKLSEPSNFSRKQITYSTTSKTLTPSTGSDYPKTVYSFPSNSIFTIAKAGGYTSSLEIWILQEVPKSGTGVKCYSYTVIGSSNNKSVSITNLTDDTLYYVVAVSKSKIPEGKEITDCFTIFGQEAVGFSISDTGEAGFTNCILDKGCSIGCFDIIEINSYNTTHALTSASAPFLGSDLSEMVEGDKNNNGVYITGSKNPDNGGSGQFIIKGLNSLTSYNLNGIQHLSLISNSAGKIINETAVLFSNSGGSLEGTWEGTVTGGSDYRLKKEIFSLEVSYSQFFDYLRPVTFKYYNPSDHRDVYRCGFIAQEVAQALEWAGLTTDDWGGLVTFNSDEPHYGLTYTEFIALNTQQIQLLKPRMIAAEQKIAELENEVAKLRTIVSNLKIS